MSEARNRLLAELYEKYYDSVFHVCYQQVGYQARLIPLVEDCIHDAFVAALQYYEAYKDFENPMGWITISARNRVKSELRKKRFREQPVHLERLAKEQELQRNVLATDVERWLDREEASSNLEIILKLLTDRERMVYDACFEQNLSLKETVELTGLSANAVRSAIDRIRQRAKRFFHISIIIFSIRCIFHISRTM